jgi:hypothetical protein
LFKSSDQDEFYGKVAKVKEAGIFEFLRTTVTHHHTSNETLMAREEFKARGHKALGGTPNGPQDNSISGLFIRAAEFLKGARHA